MSGRPSTPRKRLINRIERLAIRICKQRSGGWCELCYAIDGIRNPGAVVDHCFSRMVKDLFLDYRNLTHLCGFHNSSKTSSQKAFSGVEKQVGTAKQVHEYVMAREGAAWYAVAARKAGAHKPYAWDMTALEHQESVYKRTLNEREYRVIGDAA